MAGGLNRGGADLKEMQEDGRFCRAYLRTMDAERAAAALRRGELDTGGLELSAVSELRVSEKGIEVKLVDRVRALEALWKLLDTGEPQGSDPLYQALTALGQEQENAHGE